MATVRATLIDCLVQSTTKDGLPLSNDNVCLNEAARLLHMAIDLNGRSILESIYSAAEDDDKRAQTDDKLLRFDSKWNDLAEIMNNNDKWNSVPENLFLLDRRLSFIDPSNTPIIPWTGVLVRTTYNAYRGHFTKVKVTKFDCSGQLEAMSRSHLGDLFLEDAKEIFKTESEDFHLLLLYAFLLFDEGEWPSYLTRKMLASYRYDSHATNNKDNVNDAPVIGKRKNSVDALETVLFKVLKPNENDETKNQN